MKRIIISLLIISPYLIKAQGHVLGIGAGINILGPSANINYQYTYKLLNCKTKLAYIPQGFYYVPNNSFMNDYLLGIQTKEGKKVLLSLNTGISILYVGRYKYYDEISNQINFIQNFSLAFCINPQHRITTDISLSPYHFFSISKYGENTTSGLLLTIEIGYSFKFNNPKKDKNSTD